jgi:hypothetical protein
MRLSDTLGPLLLFAVAILVIGEVVTFGLERWDWGFLIPWFVVFFAIAWFIDIYDRKRRRLSERQTQLQERSPSDRTE